METNATLTLAEATEEFNRELARLAPSARALSAAGLRWICDKGRLPCTRTPHGTRLFRRSDVLELARKRAAQAA